MDGITHVLSSTNNEAVTKRGPTYTFEITLKQSLNQVLVEFMILEILNDKLRGVFS